MHVLQADTQLCCAATYVHLHTCILPDWPGHCAWCTASRHVVAWSCPASRVQAGAQQQQQQQQQLHASPSLSGGTPRGAQPVAHLGSAQQRYQQLCGELVQRNTVRACACWLQHGCELSATRLLPWLQGECIEGMYGVTYTQSSTLCVHCISQRSSTQRPVCSQLDCSSSPSTCHHPPATLPPQSMQTAMHFVACNHAELSSAQLSSAESSKARSSPATLRPVQPSALAHCHELLVCSSARPCHAAASAAQGTISWHCLHQVPHLSACCASQVTTSALKASHLHLPPTMIPSGNSLPAPTLLLISQVRICTCLVHPPHTQRLCDHAGLEPHTVVAQSACAAKLK
jgi:hypothetical protein